jgi:DNA-binding PadR family transcriptional regulator
VSHWREEEKRNKRFYRLSPQGEIILYQLLNEHEAMNAAIDRIMAPSLSPQAVPIADPEMDSQEKEQLQ